MMRGGGNVRSGLPSGDGAPDEGLWLPREHRQIVCTCALQATERGATTLDSYKG